MVPMLTCGLVRWNFAFATGVLLWTVSFRSPGTPDKAIGTLSTARARAVLDGPHAPQRFRPGSGTRRFRDDLLRHVLRNLGVGVELHAVAGPALGLRPKVTHVAEHLGERHQRLDDPGAGALLHRLDDATPRVEVADDVAHVVLGRRDLDGHHRLEQRGVGLAGRLLHHHRTGDLERHLGRVDLVVLTVQQRQLDTDQRVAGQHAVLHGVLRTGVHRRDVLPRDAATGHGVD